jgi:hypothetical protein
MCPHPVSTIPRHDAPANRGDAQTEPVPSAEIVEMPLREHLTAAWLRFALPPIPQTP